MGLKSVLFLVIIGTVMLHNAEAKPKLGLIKAKVALASAPHVIAHVSVAKEVKAKTKIAFAKSLAALKASKVAAVSAITAPFRVAKRTFALKVGAVKAAKAIKIAKLAKAAKILANLKKGPIILPVPVAVPVKHLPILPLKAAKVGAGLGLAGGAGLGLGAGTGLGLGAGLGLGSLKAPSLAIGGSAGPLGGLIAGATNAFKSVGASFPLLSGLTGPGLASSPLLSGLTGPGLFSSVKDDDTDIKAVSIPQPTYRLIPEVGFTNYHKVSYGPPKVELDVPLAPTPTPAPLSSGPYPEPEPVIPADESNSGNVASDLPDAYGLPPAPVHDTYGPPPPPADTYGLPPN